MVVVRIAAFSGIGPSRRSAGVSLLCGAVRRTQGGATRGGRGGRDTGRSSSAPPTREQSVAPPKSLKLQRVLQNAGVASRRGSDAIIKSGRVTVNGVIVDKPFATVLLPNDSIQVDGERLVSSTTPFSSANGAAEGEGDDFLYVALHKPRGYICSAAPEAKKPVLDLVEPLLQELRGGQTAGQKGANGAAAHDKNSVQGPRLFTVGRLDVNTSGLLLLTNDGQWCNDVQHPSAGVEKEYSAWVRTTPTEDNLRLLDEGCIVQGKTVRPLDFYVEEGHKDGTARLSITVGDGRKHEVRELVKKAGLDLIKLKRHRIGSLTLASLGLKIGDYVCLSRQEAYKLGGAGRQNTPPKT